MKRLVTLILLASVALTAVALHGVAPTPVAAASGTITVTPGSGTQDDTFVFTGVGFDAGTVLAVVYQDPSGQQYTYYAPDGSADLITADGDGNWILTVHPRTDFSGAYAGTWTVAFCTDAGDCFSGTIDIST